jgi:hypothetical protein
MTLQLPLLAALQLSVNHQQLGCSATMRVQPSACHKHLGTWAASQHTGIYCRLHLRLVTASCLAFCHGLWCVSLSGP